MVKTPIYECYQLVNVVGRPYRLYMDDHYQGELTREQVIALRDALNKAVEEGC